MNFFKEIKFRSRDYREFVATFPCCNAKCKHRDDPGRIDCDHYGDRGYALKSHDTQSHPLCWRCHQFATDDPKHRFPDCTKEETAEMIKEARLEIMQAWIHQNTKPDKSKKKNRRAVKLPIPARYYQP